MRRHGLKQVKVVKIVWKSNKQNNTNYIFEPFEWKEFEHENPKLYQNNKVTMQESYL